MRRPPESLIVPLLLLMAGAIFAPGVVAQGRSSDASGGTDWQHVLLDSRALASGVFTCEAGLKGNQWSGTCFASSLAPLRAAERASPEGAAFDETVCRVLERKKARIPTGAMEIDASGVVPAGQSLPDSVTAYYLVYLPFTATASLGVTDSDPGDGTPWLHHAGTCTAHLMWAETKTLRGSSR